jgi:hypothetical protein
MKFLLALAFAATAFAADNPIRTVNSDCPAISNQPICEFRAGYLMRFSYSFDPVVRVYAPDGHFALNIPIYLPGADFAWAQDVAVDTDGSFIIGASGTVHGNLRETRHGLVFDDPNGLQTKVIDTKDWSPDHVAIAPDHSIWVLGAAWSHPYPASGDYMIVRNYSRTGELLGSYVPRSTFPKGLEPGGPGSASALLASQDRIIVVAVSGNTSETRELIELDQDGKLLGRMPWDKRGASNFALTADAHLYWYGQRPEEGIDQIDVPASTSNKLAVPAHVGYLMGADQNNLVFQVRGGPGNTAAGWFTQPAGQRSSNRTDPKSPAIPWRQARPMWFAVNPFSPSQRAEFRTRSSRVMPSGRSDALRASLATAVR